ncbi:MAG: hypothetical protein ACI3VB_05080 [Oscillospiraceae bacterium]
MSTFARIIRRYGDKAVLQGEGGEAVCFIQPVLSRNIEKTWKQMGGLGERDMARFYGFFPPEAKLEGCGNLSCGGREYEILRAELFRGESEDSHWEALLRIQPEAADD